MGVRHEGAFGIGAEEHKQRNFDADPRVPVTTGSTGARSWDSGIGELSTDPSLIR